MAAVEAAACVMAQLGAPVGVLFFAVGVFFTFREGSGVGFEVVFRFAGPEMCLFSRISITQSRLLLTLLYAMAYPFRQKGGNQYAFGSPRWTGLP